MDVHVGRVEEHNKHSASPDSANGDAIERAAALTAELQRSILEYYDFRGGIQRDFQEQIPTLPRGLAQHDVLRAHPVQQARLAEEMRARGHHAVRGVAHLVKG